MPETTAKEFTGWWIPEYIVTHFRNKKINIRELLFMAMIHSLSRKKDGCFAGNAYLGEQVGISKKHADVIVTKLKKLKLIQRWKVQGTKRYLKPFYPKGYTKKGEINYVEFLENRKVDYKGKVFKGWWIPALAVEFFQDKEINDKELILLAEIISLSKNKEGCHASNSYFGRKLLVGSSRIRQMLSNLKELDIVRQIKFDGKKRWLDVTVKLKDGLKETKEFIENNPIKTKEFIISSQVKIKESSQVKIKESSQVKIKDHIKQGYKPRIKDKNISKQVRNTDVLNRPVTNYGLLIQPFDKRAAAEFRSILVQYDSDLTKYNYRKGKVRSKPVKYETLVDVLFRIRTERKTTKLEIKNIISWLRTNWNGKFTPKIRTSTDLFDKWERFRDAVIRDDGKEVKEEQTTWSSATELVRN